MGTDLTYTISYGKLQVPFYRVYARPLAGIAPIPESAFTGRENTLFAMEVDVEVFGQRFLPAYTAGDNTLVVATDSMKNWILQQALAYDGATLEGFLDLVARQLLSGYAHMEALRVTGRELPFAAVPVPGSGPGVFGASDVLFSHARDDYATAALDYARADDGGVTLTGHRCARVGLQLLKVTGSSFTRFVRDEHTTLPERADRPLSIALDVSWRYAHPAADLLGPDVARYVATEQVRDLCQVVFHEFVSESIQHLVHEMGQRILARFPQLVEVAFVGQNRTPDPVAISPTDARIRVYSHPFPAFGLITLTLTRQE
ncbi:MAG: urate oxidase [Ktedonobacterales bacterium]|nr:urate oxidase [Ktedonobacterales bacterium]